MELIIIYHFVLVLWGTLIGLFGEKIIIGNPFFKGFIVEAEVIEMLDFSMLKKHIFVTVVKYKKYDTILMIWLIIECIEIVKLQHLLVGVIVVIVALLLHPLLYGLTYRDVQSHVHMID